MEIFYRFYFFKKEIENMHKDNIYVIAAGAERACVKINYMGHEISIAAEAIGVSCFLTRTSVRVYRGNKDVTNEFNIDSNDVKLETISAIKLQINGCGVYTPNHKYIFLKDPEVIVSALDFKLERGDIWAINTIHGRPVDITKISIVAVDMENNRYTDARSVSHYVADLFWEEKCIALNEAKAYIVLHCLQEIFADDPTWQEIARKRKQRRDLELA